MNLLSLAAYEWNKEGEGDWEDGEDDAEDADDEEGNEGDEEVFEESDM